MELLGPTGSGKSFFETTVLKERVARRGSHVVVIATKPADDTIAALGWPVIDQWPPNEWKKENRQVIYWAKAPTPDEHGMAMQRAAVNDVLHKLWKPQSNVIVVFDEQAYLESELGLRTIVTRYWREARSLGITLVASTQRPAFVSRYMHSESTWAVFFAPKDEDDLKRMAEVAGNRKHYREILASLDSDEKEFLLINTRSRESYISRIDDTPITVTTQHSEHPRKTDTTV